MRGTEALRRFIDSDGFASLIRVLLYYRSSLELFLSSSIAIGFIQLRQFLFAEPKEQIHLVFRRIVAGLLS